MKVHLFNVYKECGNDNCLTELFEFIRTQGIRNYILMGDFNAHHKSLSTFTLTPNSAGRLLHTFIREQSAVVANTSTPTHKRGAILDHFITTPFLAKFITHIRILPHFHSDHSPLIITLNIPTFSIIQNYTSTNILTTESPKDRCQFIRSMDKLSARLNMAIAQIRLMPKGSDVENRLDKLVKVMSDEIMKRARTDFTQRHKVRYTRTTTTLPPHIISDLEIIEFMFSNLKEDWSNNESYLEIRDRLDAYFKKKSAKGWNNFLKRFESPSSAKAFWKRFQTSTGKNKRTVLRDVTGRPILEEASQVKHFSDMLIPPNEFAPSKRFTPSLKAQAESKYHDDLEKYNLFRSTWHATPKNNHCAPIVTKHEFQKFLKNKASNTPGPTGITRNIYKLLGKHMLETVRSIFNLMLTFGYWPRTWKRAIICPIPKSSPGWRPISLLEVQSKHFESILNSRMVKTCQEKGLLSPEQAGGRPRHSTSISLAKLTQTVKEYLNKNCYFIELFMDVENAFTSLTPAQTFKVLQLCDFDTPTLAILWSYFSARQAAIKSPTLAPNFLEFLSATPQGSPLAPTIFILVMDGIMQAIRKANPSLYVDDSSFGLPFRATKSSIAKTTKTLQKILVEIEQWCTITGITFKPSKYKYIVLKGKRKKPLNGIVLKLCDKPIKQVQSHRQFNIMYDEHLDFTLHMHRPPYV